MLQPGAKFQNDGFGLITGTAVYKEDRSGSSAFLARGQPFPLADYSFCKVHKAATSLDALGITTYTVDYVGISPTINGGVRTLANASSANGLTSEPITSHPNFFTLTAPFTSVIAGTSYTQSPMGPLVEIKSPSDYVSITTGSTITTVTKKQSFIGANGACFESSNGGRFIGFVDPTYKSLYGKTNYLATTSTYSGVIYTSSLGEVQALLLLLNVASQTASWGVFNLLPAWAPIGTEAGVGHRNLLSQVNVEEYASLYKIMYEIRYAKYGWDSKVYVNIT
jgi:hypothetical protein